RQENVELTEINQLTEEDLAQCKAKENRLQQELNALRESHQADAQQFLEEREHWQQERRHLRKQFEFLEERERGLAGCIDFEARLSTVAKLSIPILGEGCVVHSLSETGLPTPLLGALKQVGADIALADGGRYSNGSLSGSEEVARIIQSGQG